MRIQPDTFADIVLHCQCFASESKQECVCQHSEKVVRAYAAGVPLRRMTTEERDWAASDADWAAEGALNKEELLQLSDKDLAQNLLNAWNDYVKSHY